MDILMQMVQWATDSSTVASSICYDFFEDDAEYTDESGDESDTEEDN